MGKIRSVAEYIDEVIKYQDKYDNQLTEKILEEIEKLDSNSLVLDSRKFNEYLSEIWEESNNQKKEIESKRYTLSTSYNLLKMLQYQPTMSGKLDLIDNKLSMAHSDLDKNYKDLKEIVYKYILSEDNKINEYSELLSDLDKHFIKKPKKNELDYNEFYNELKEKIIQIELENNDNLLLEITKSIKKNKQIFELIQILSFLNNLFRKDFFNKKRFSNLVNLLEESNKRFFYRGQNKSYADKDKHKFFSIVPSLMHMPNVEVNEYSIFQDILRLDNDAFDKQKSYLDIHKQMQHYTEISRVIDITTAALSGLFFAVGELKEPPEEDPCVFMFAVEKEKIKRPESDGTQIKLALSTIKDDQRINLKQAILDFESNIITSIDEFNEKESVKKLSYSVRKNDGVLTKIEVPKDISDIEFVLPNMDNKRIVAQQGAFIAVGLLTTQEEIYEKIEPYLRFPRERLYNREDMHEKDYMIITIDRGYAYQIKLELEQLGITKAVMYPDIQKIGQYFKHDLYNR